MLHRSLECKHTVQDGIRRSIGEDLRHGGKITAILQTAIVFRLCHDDPMAKGFLCGQRHDRRGEVVDAV